MKLRLDEIIHASGGRLLCGDKDAWVTSFSTDSRTIKKGTMFIPIEGERVDSHAFIAAALAQGAAAAYTQRKEPLYDGNLVLVDNTVDAFQKTASYYRQQFSLPLIGITGSAGKTSAKEMIALALSSKFKVMRTQGNQNSQVGVPMTLFRLKKDHQAAVVEMGISMPGEMERIAQTARPTMAVITNIGVSHIEFLSSRENILKEKLNIAAHIPPDGALFVNADDDLLAALTPDAFGYPIIRFGLAAESDYRATEIRQTDKGCFFNCSYPGGSNQVFIPAIGAHNVRNALSAIAVSHRLGISMDEVIRALGLYKPPEMRQQIIQTPLLTIIDDSYNASPDSVKGALDILADHSGTRKIAVLGDMLELGDYAYTGHHDTGRYAAHRQIDFLIGIGSHADSICEGFGRARSRFFEEKTEAIDFLREFVASGDVLLIKGSRGMKMEDITKSLKDWSGAGDENA